MFLYLPTIEGVSFSGTYYVQAWGICLHCCSFIHNELGTDTGWWEVVETNLLCEQITTWGRDSPFTIRESHLGSSTCYVEAPTLLPSSHCCGSNLTPSSITTLEGWLHREDCKMGNDPRSFWYQVYVSHFYKGSGPCRFGGWVCWGFLRRKLWKAKHGWKIS